MDNPFTPKVEDLGEDQVYPKMEEPMCLLDTKVEEPSGDLEERESRAR